MLPLMPHAPIIPPHRPTHPLLPPPLRPLSRPSSPVIMHPPSSPPLTPIQLLCKACDLAASQLTLNLASAPASSTAPTTPATTPATTPSHSHRSPTPPKKSSPHQSPHPHQRSFVCPFQSCTKTFARVYNLKAHQRVHSREMPYSCHRCSKRFRWRSSLTSHTKFHLKLDAELAHRHPVRPSSASTSHAPSRATLLRLQSRPSPPSSST